MKARVDHNTFVCVRVCMCVCMCVSYKCIWYMHISISCIASTPCRIPFFNPDIFVNDSLENNNCIIGIILYDIINCDILL